MMLILPTCLLLIVVLRRAPFEKDISSAEFQINQHTTENQAFPRVAMDGAGGFVVVWDSSSSGGFYRNIFTNSN